MIEANTTHFGQVGEELLAFAGFLEEVGRD